MEEVFFCDSHVFIVLRDRVVRLLCPAAAAVAGLLNRRWDGDRDENRCLAGLAGNLRDWLFEVRRVGPRLSDQVCVGALGQVAHEFLEVDGFCIRY